MAANHKILLALCTLLASLTLAPLRSAQAKRMAVVARGIGPGSDKAAALVGHYVGEAFASDSRYEQVSIAQALGNPDRNRALLQFQAAEDLLQKARDAYEGLDLDTAEKSLKAALQRYERHAAYVGDFKKVADLLMLLGAVRILKGDERNGTLTLEQALNVYPAAEPDPRIFNPAMRVQFSQTVLRLNNRPTGTISVSSSPGYAEVFIDGSFRGVSPVVVEGVSEGPHYVRLERPGFRPQGSVIDVLGRAEASYTGAFKACAHYEEFDALVDRAARALEGGSREQTPRVAALRSLAELLDADTLFLTEVRLDGERVRLVSELFSIDGKTTEQPGEHVFAYEGRLASYEREVRIFLHTAYGLETTPTAAVAARPSTAVAASEAGRGPRARAAADKTLPHAAGAKGCGLVSCSALKKIVAGSLTATAGATLVVGGVEWLMAKQKHTQWRKTTQVADNQGALRARGYNQALLGDVLVGVGVATTLASVLTWTLWHPSPSIEDVARQQAPEPASRRHQDKGSSMVLQLAPMDHGASLTGLWSF